VSCARCYQDCGSAGFPVNRAFNDESEYYRRRREDDTKYMVARNGDWCIAPFQCVSCWFLNIHSRRPRKIRRVNLDMFWSWESSTVLGTTSRLKGIIKGSTTKGRPVPLEPFPPWPLEDSAGMGIPLLMLEKSIEPGKNSADHKQFDSCRPLRSAASNVFAASSLGASKPLVLKSTKGEVPFFSGCYAECVDGKVCTGNENSDACLVE
jgi:hypothetical protein